MTKMSEIEDWIEADWLQERLDLAEELYNINRHLSIKLFDKRIVLKQEEIILLNKKLGEIIKKLRGKD